jgi:heme exporter protein D
MTIEVSIVESAIRDFFNGMPYALAIWIALVTAVTAGCVAMVYPVLRKRYLAAKARREAARLRRVQLAAQAAELQRYAGEVTVAAARSKQTAQRWQTEWESVCRAREAAWNAFVRAEDAARRAAQAAAFPLQLRLDVEELRTRERHLDRAATAAYRRGELSVADLNDILSRRNGWDPHRHPADHEVALRRIACRRRWAAYQAIAEIERSIRHRADVAALAELSLLDEAYAGRMRAQRAAESLQVSEKLERSRPLRLRLAYP